MKPAFILVIAGLATTITAQASGVSPCILGCIDPAATQAGCASVTDLQCICTNTDYQAAAMQCLQSTCTSADISAATQLQETQCAAISPP